MSASLHFLGSTPTCFEGIKALHAEPGNTSLRLHIFGLIQFSLKTLTQPVAADPSPERQTQKILTFHRPVTATYAHARSKGLHTQNVYQYQ